MAHRSVAAALAAAVMLSPAALAAGVSVLGVEPEAGAPAAEDLDLPESATVGVAAPGEVGPESEGRRPLLARESVELPPLEVRGTVLRGEIGKAQLTRGDIQRLQDGNGDMNRLLRALPNVQFEESLSDARKLGEILPARVSISGSRFYDNRFDVDGISTNSVLDPASRSSATAVSDTPGYAQSQFFDTDLLGSLEVYDSAAPARMGGFTGGVVSARTRDPGRKRSLSAFFSGTGDSLVRFHIYPPPFDPDDPEGFQIGDQPRYSKYRYGLTYDQPIGEHSGLLLSLARIESDIPSLHFDGFRSERRSNTNLMAKGITRVGEFDLTLLANYTPYRSEQFLVNVRDSDFLVTGGGYATGARLQGQTRWGVLDLDINVAVSENTREAPKDYFNWLTSSNGPNWGEVIYSLNSREGGYGDIDKTQSNLRTAAALTRPQWDGMLEIGGEVERVGATYLRREDTYLYGSGMVDGRIRCVGSAVPACVNGNQALFTRNVYPADGVDVAVLQAGLYGEWTRDWKDWNWRLGVRLDSDDFQRNINWAPRSLLTWTPWETVSFHAGANRYYSRSLLSYKLREARAPYLTEYRAARGGSVGGSSVLLVEDVWERTSAAGNIIYSGTVADLRTPYSDELAGGVSFMLLGGTAGVRVIRRQYRDEFSQRESPEDPNTGLVTRSPANDGRSEYESVVLAWARRFGPVDFGFNLTWSESRRTNPEYDSRSSIEADDDLVYYRNEIMPRGRLDILADDFARPLVANLSLVMQPLPGLDLSVTGRLRERYDNLKDSGRRQRAVLSLCLTCPLAEFELPVFEETHRPATVLFDAKLGYTLRLREAQAVDVEVLIDNLLDARTHTTTGTHAYEAGRGFWLLARYRYGS